MLTVHCPTCDAALGLGDEMAGRQVRCGGCQEVFLVEPPSPRRGRREDEDDDRPTPRRSRRDADDDAPRRKKHKKRRKKEAAGIPGLAMAAAILFLIWGGLGAIYALYGVINLVRLLDFGAPATVIVNGLITVVIQGVFSGYLISSGLTVLNGQAESIASIGIAVLSICATAVVLSVVSVALIAPVFVAEIVLIAVVWVLVLTSGIIVGGVFCLVVSEKYERWQRT